MDKLERIVEWEPAFDRRDPDPNKNYGIHGVSVQFILKGPKGATQFVLFTNWHLANVQKELDSKTVPKQFTHLHCHPLPADVGYHSLTRRHNYQEERDCTYTVTGKCYYDGSGLRAYDVYKRLVEHGDKGVWEALE